MSYDTAIVSSGSMVCVCVSTLTNRLEPKLARMLANDEHNCISLDGRIINKFEPHVWKKKYDVLFIETLLKMERCFGMDTRADSLIVDKH